MVYTEEELRAANPELQVLTAADTKLIGVFGDTIHQNDGTHLREGVSVAEDTAWQRRWIQVIAGPHSSFYSLPRSKEGKRLPDLLVAEWKGCRERRWNSERVLCFPACILHKLKGCRKGSKEIRVILAQRMDVWESGRFDTLCNSVEDQWRNGDGLRPPRQQTEEDWLG